MNQINNPFSPGAGSPPPELVGRDAIIEKSKVLLGRVQQRRSEKSLLLVGLRGVGKTVLLNEIERLTNAAGYHTITLEAHEDKSLAALLAPHLRRVLFELDRMEGLSNKVKRGLGVLKSFIGSIKVKVAEVEFGIDIEPERGTADSGDLEVDLSNLFIAVAEAAQDRGTALAILIDEIQYFSSKELSALIMGMHKMQQRQLPLVLIGAGLPILTRLAGESKSYAERLFEFPAIGPLSETDATKALRDPVIRAGVDFSGEAIKEIYRLTQGYPYFIQEWGYQSWNHAEAAPITLSDVKRATKVVMQRLDENFFRVRFDRLTPREKEYLRAMAHLGSGPQRSGDIAEVLGVKMNSLGPTRGNLINKGMIYSPEYGDMAFTVPLFDEFMRRAMPNFSPRA
ncbi:MAG: AAA family ATPase [Elusimicrobia bacterium GWC2_61_19]|nr:MAG: AAA family ATPase [Elusimicrobia bacterium GWC2_61_19]